jgi:sugar-specific transcriptional regulator TrmB
MKKSQYMGVLANFGLSHREARIYLALLNKKDFTVSEIAKVSGMPRHTIYEILDTLIKKGVCTEKIGKVKRYKAIDPKIVFRSLIDQYKDHFEAQLCEKEKLALEVAKDFSMLYEKNRERVDPLEYIEVLKDRKQIYNRWRLLQNNAQHKILSFVKAPYASSSPIENIDDEIDVLKKNVEIRAIYECKDVEKDEFVRALSSWIPAGEKVRVIKELPVKLVIFDERITLIALNDPVTLEPSITTMIINHVGFAVAQEAVFESYWQRAIAFEEFMASGELE